MTRPADGTPIARLRRVVAAIERGDTVEASDAAWFCSAVRRYDAEAGSGLELAAALGLIPAPGQDAWWTVERRRKRDAVIRRLKTEHLPDLSIAAAAREITKEAHAYLTRGHHDKSTPRKALIAAAIETGSPFPGARQLETILRNQP